jgi:hypothetical protein
VVEAPEAKQSKKGSRNQGCQMVYFQSQNPNLGKFWRSSDWKMLIYFMAIWNTYSTNICDIL